jgi:MoaA/NifB/PqqE/SkfB family radical SAM enzyme
MHQDASARLPGAGPLRRLFKRRVPDDVPVTAASIALFRFGEQCNYRCPMCSNTGEAALFFHRTDELLRRLRFLRRCGFQRVVVTGGEPTIHPGFWTIVEQLGAAAMLWDANTHGGSFAQAGFAQRAVANGLRRAIVSLHSMQGATSAAIFGTTAAAHHSTVAGIDRLLEAGVDVMLNCVITRLNLTQLDDYLQAATQRFCGQVAFKFVFPSTLGKGGRWPGIATLRYSDVRQPVQRLRALAAHQRLRICFESLPNCILGDPDAVNYSRSTFGETHYLDDATGDRVYSMRHVEAELSALGDVCRQCVAVRDCSGVSRQYARRYGVDELTPLLPQPDALPTRAQPAARTVSGSWKPAGHPGPE